MVGNKGEAALGRNVLLAYHINLYVNISDETLHEFISYISLAEICIEIILMKYPFYKSLYKSGNSPVSQFCL